MSPNGGSKKAATCHGFLSLGYWLNASGKSSSAFSLPYKRQIKKHTNAGNNEIITMIIIDARGSGYWKLD